MPFLAKCYNGHKTLIDDDLDGETIECPICQEDFIATKNYEELGKIDDWKVPLYAKGYIHLAMGLMVALLFTYMIELFSPYPMTLPWKLSYYLSFSLGFFYAIRGIFEIFKGKDPFAKLFNRLASYYYIVRKKIQFFGR